MIGQIIDDHYHVEALVGRGGMGVVYRAADLIERRPVALKFLHFYLDAEAEMAISRFYREFRVLVRLDHPGIVRAYGDGTYNGVPYLVLEFLAGQTLKDNLAAGPLPRPRLLSIARQICEALAYLHAQSIIHRDLKPGNLMLLSPTDGKTVEDGVQVKLMDFGLVRLTDLSRQLTQEGVALGTVAYMAPEQAQGLPVDFRADLYALGAVLYEMAAGRPPFNHENPAMILMQQLTTPPPPPRQFNPELDEPLEALILKLLAKEPAQRPAGAEQVAVRLAHLADESAPAPGPPSPIKRVDLIPRIPIIGRGAVLEKLTQHWQVAQAGQGQVVVLAGAAGSGKTRLLTEVGLQARLGNGRFLSGPCREHTSLPYQPLVDMLDKLLVDLPATARDTLPAELARLLPSANADTPGEVAVADHAEARLRLFAACWQFLQQATQTQPLMMAVEDGQWANPTTLELLGYLARRADQARLLLVLTYRPEEVERNTPLAPLLQDWHHNRVGRVITLNLLTRNQVGDFLRAALGQKNLPAWLVDTFYRATDGNPLFLEETLKALAAEGQVAEWVNRESSQSSWSGPSEMTLQLPQSVLALAERRLQALVADDRTILTAAAVLGAEFSFDLLQAVTKLDEDTLIDAIDRLLAAHLIEELPVRDGEDRYRFTQEALRQALLTAISRRRLRSLHRRAGETIQTLYDTGRPRYWPLLAYHFAQAGDEERSLKYYKLAGDAAARVYANAEAAAHYNRALEIVRARLERDEAVESEQLIYLYTHRGFSLAFGGQYEAAWRSYEEMETLARERGDRALELATLLAQARLRAIPTPLHNFEQAETLSMQALDLAVTLGDRRAEAKALENLLTVCSLTGRAHQAIEYGEQSLAIARELDNQEQVAFTLTGLDNVYAATGRLERALAALREAVEIWRALGNTLMLATNLSIVSIRYYLLNDYDHSRAAAEEALRLGESIHDPWAQSYSRWALALIHMEQGHLDKMIEAMEAVIHLGDQAEIIPVQVFSRAELAWAYGDLGAFEQGVELVQQSRTSAEALLPDWRLFPIVVMASLHLRQGDLASAEAALEEAGTIPRTEPNSALLADVWSALIEGELAQARQNYDQVITGMDKFLTHLQQMEIRSFICEGLLLKGRALLAQRRVEEAYEVLSEARAKSEAAGSRRVLWPVLLALSQVERQRGRPTEAETLRQQAQEIIEYIANHTPTRLRASFLALPDVRAVLKN